MESLAFIYTAVAYEDPNPDPELRSRLTLNFKASGALALGLLSAGVLTATLSHADSVQATLHPGDRGSGVANLQKTLGLVADGIYGSRTLSSVTTYQKTKGLVVDGIAGPQTLSSLGLPSSLRAAASNSSSANSVSEPVYVTAGVGLNVRRSPSTNSDILHTLAYGERVSLTGQNQNGWAELATGGWVARQYLSSGGRGGSGNAVPVASAAYISTRSGTGVNVRNTPSGDLVDGLANGQRIALAGSREYANGHYWVKIARGGWVAEDYVSYH
jgi:peptidoglycan hydrolase-like protein with peptidoglycan-binding domain